MGANMFFAVPGVVLDVVRARLDQPDLDRWQARVERAVAHLGWPSTQCVTRRHSAGVLLALTAPVDQLFLATEINEWALCATLADHEPQRRAALEAALLAAAIEAAGLPAAGDALPPSPDLAPVLDEPQAFARFDRLAAVQSQPRLRAILGAADRHGAAHVLDETHLMLGSGCGGRDYPLDSLPREEEVPWPDLHNVPTALVTGSNGKTTTVRLLAACARAHGWRSAYNCTDGVFVGGETRARGDYSGPAGARLVLRDPQTQAAILETARGGILRRGIAASRADVAIVTNVSSDHFGEYGIDDLAGLADVKLSVAGVVSPSGLLVLNADDALLRSQSARLGERFGRCPPIGWFSLSADDEFLVARRAADEPTCAARHGRLILTRHGIDHDLGAIEAMPLSIGGLARYNVANLAGAALAASALGIPAATIAAVIRRFGTSLDDNPGRMMRIERNGVQVLIDYAHNPDGLRGFLEVASRLRRPQGRLGLLLGHAGNRKDEDIAEVARVAASFNPDLIVIKENEAQLRGRAPGEVPRILRAELIRQGMSEAALPVRNSEMDAVHAALDWARAGDVLALPVHSADARAQSLALLNEGSPEPRS